MPATQCLEYISDNTLNNTQKKKKNIGLSRCTNSTIRYCQHLKRNG